jgi:phosphopantothenate-cysteine ligase
MKFLITSGGTKAPIDDVRHIGNNSTGRFGSILALAAMKAGHEVVFIYAKGSDTPFSKRIDATKGIEAEDNVYEMLENYNSYSKQYDGVEYVDYNDYFDKVKGYSCGEYEPDVIILAAAVSDYAPVPSNGKISSNEEELIISLKKTTKIIKLVKKWCPFALLVGFKLLTDVSQKYLIEACEKQIQSTNADMCVGNLLNEIKSGNHNLTVVRPNKEPFFLKHSLPIYNAAGLIDIIEGYY